MFHGAEESIVGGPESLFEQRAEEDAEEDEGAESDGFGAGVSGADAVTWIAGKYEWILAEGVEQWDAH